MESKKAKELSRIVGRLEYFYKSLPKGNCRSEFVQDYHDILTEAKESLKDLNIKPFQIPNSAAEGSTFTLRGFGEPLYFDGDILRSKANQLLGHLKGELEVLKEDKNLERTPQEEVTFGSLFRKELKRLLAGLEVIRAKLELNSAAKWLVFVGGIGGGIGVIYYLLRLARVVSVPIF